MKLKYLFGISALALSASLALTSCDDETYDVVGNPNNLVYVNIAHDYPSNMPKNTYAYGLYQTPAGPVLGSTPGDVELYVQCTKNAPSDITVKFELAPDMEVDGFDKFPENSGIEFSLPEATVTIPKGSNRSNSVFLTIDDTNADWTKFDGSAYILPIRIASVSGGAVASVEKYCAYVGVNVDHKDGMINPDATSAEGTRVTDCSAWTGTYSVPATGAGGNLNMLSITDNNQWSFAFFVANHADGVNEEVIVDIDLGSVQDVRTVEFGYYYNWYTIKDGTLYTSTDGVDYTDQGTLTWGGNGIRRYFTFWAPTSMRYVRLVSHSFYGGTGEGTAFSIFNIYK